MGGHHGLGGWVQGPTSKNKLGVIHMSSSSTSIRMSLYNDITLYYDIGENNIYVIIYIVTFLKHKNPLFFVHYHVGHGADTKFHIKSRRGLGGGMEGLIFETMALEVGTRKIYFQQYDISIKTLYGIL